MLTQLISSLPCCLLGVVALLCRIVGFPKKFANPECKVVADTLVGRLSYGGMEIAKGES